MQQAFTAHNAEAVGKRAPPDGLLPTPMVPVPDAGGSAIAQALTAKRPSGIAEDEHGLLAGWPAHRSALKQGH